jgi:hypothetical protein
VIVVAVRLYLRCNLSYCDVAELLIERGVEVDHVTVFRLVQCFTPLLADAARFCRHAPADRWYVDETYDKVNGLWRYVSSAPAATPPRHAGSSARAMTMLKVRPTEVITDAAPVYPAVLDESAQAPAQTDARATDRPDRADDHRRTRMHADPSPWPLRTRARRPARAPRRCGVHEPAQAI